MRLGIGSASSDCCTSRWQQRGRGAPGLRPSKARYSLLLAVVFAAEFPRLTPQSRQMLRPRGSVHRRRRRRPAPVVRAAACSWSGLRAARRRIQHSKPARSRKDCEPAAAQSGRRQARAVHRRRRARECAGPWAVVPRCRVRPADRAARYARSAAPRSIAMRAGERLRRRWPRRPAS